MRTNRPRKYLDVYTALRRDLQSGRWKHGDRMPTEAELVETFGVSRITVARAMRDLQAAGLVKRRAGSGTFATSPGMASRQSFGLLIPDLGETDIFEPICQGMMASPLARQHALQRGRNHALTDRFKDVGLSRHDGVPVGTPARAPLGQQLRRGCLQEGARAGVP